jgi:predicted secreted protein
MRFIAILLAAFLLFSCDKGVELTQKLKKAEEQNSEEQYKKELDEIKRNLKGDVKIKLKKEAKGGYSWEITGKDAQEIIKANDILVKKLSN